MLLRVVDEIGEMQPQVASLDAGTKDEALVVAAKSGDGQAFEMLHHRHRAKMLHAALRFSRNLADTEDFMLQSFEKAFLHLEKFEGHSSFSTWLTRITINEALMWLRKTSSRVEIPLEQSSPDNGATLAPDFPDSSLNPEDRKRGNPLAKSVCSKLKVRALSFLLQRVS